VRAHASAINKMMQQLFIETQALFIETLPDYLLQLK
jgi:ATP-dependent DNA helicase RecG